MNKSAKVGIAALAVVATGSLGLALPALAHDRGERESSSESRQAHSMEADAAHRGTGSGERRTETVDGEGRGDIAGLRAT